jgi:hypothetical protein
MFPYVVPGCNCATDLEVALQASVAFRGCNCIAKKAVDKVLIAPTPPSMITRETLFPGRAKDVIPERRADAEPGVIIVIMMPQMVLF